MTSNEITYTLTTVSFRRVFLTTLFLALFVYIDAAFFFYWAERDVNIIPDAGNLIYFALTVLVLIIGSFIFTKFFIKNHANKVTFNEQGIIKYKKKPILIPWSILGSYHTMIKEPMPFVLLNSLYHKFSKKLEPETIFYFIEQPSRAGFSHDAKSHRIRVPNEMIEKVKAIASEKVHMQSPPPIAGKQKKQLIWILIIFGIAIVIVPILIVIFYQPY